VIEVDNRLSEEQIRQIVREEIAAHKEQLNKEIGILTGHLSNELEKLLREYQTAYTTAAINIVSEIRSSS
jgi:bacterioferritin-associated ferredoxin